MICKGQTVFDVQFLGFPRRTHHVLLPAGPMEATRAGLALYDNTLLHQRLARALGTAVVNLRLQRIYRLGSLPASLLDQRWWRGWCEQVAIPSIGPVERAAFRLWEDRIVALLMTASGQPRGFVKVWRDPPGPPRPVPYMQPEVLRRLSADRRPAFRVCALLLEGALEGWSYQLFEPLPVGSHSRVAPEPARIARIFDEMHERLADVPRSANIPPHYVIGHGDFTPRNVRRASDGNVWVLDWEYARWSPRLVDELQFWTAEFSWRVRPRPDRDARRVLARLRERGDDASIAEALCWGSYMTPGQSAIAKVVAREIGVERKATPVQSQEKKGEA
jgi:Phosphotransferase enzyme family